MSPTTASVTTIRPPRAEPLEGTEQDQLGHALRETAQHGADEEDDDGRLQHELAAEQVAELPVQRAGNRRRQEIGGHDPGEVIEPTEVADDGRQRRRDDRLVERGEQQHEQQRGKDQPHLPARLVLRLDDHAAVAYSSPGFA